jgi:predicted lipase
VNFNRQLALTSAEAIQSLYAGQIAPNLVARETDTQVLVEQMPDGVFAVIFPGTASRRDWITDLKVKRVAWEPGDPFYPVGIRVHRGFAAAYNSIHTGLVTLLPKRCTIVIAGHSLGGALATLAASALDGLYHIRAVFTFGSPRVGNAAFARHYNERFCERAARVVNAGDPVPHIPWLLGCYRHVDTQVYLRADGGLQIDEPLRVAAGELVASVKTMNLQRPTSNLRLVVPHHIESYLGKLKGSQ